MQRQGRVEMQIGFHDTVASMDRMESGNNRLVCIVILSVIADSRVVRTGVQMLINRIFRSRPGREGQREDRIHLIGTGCKDSIYIDTAAPYGLTAPYDSVTLAGGQFFRILVGLRCSRDDRYRDLIRAVASVNGRAVVVISTVGRDVLTMPVQYRSLR